MITSIDAEKAFDKNSTSVHDKHSHQSGYRENISQIIKATYDKPIVNIPCCCCQVNSVVFDSVRPPRRLPTRLPRPWDSPGKNTGVGCHYNQW